VRQGRAPRDKPGRGSPTVINQIRIGLDRAGLTAVCQTGIAADRLSRDLRDVEEVGVRCCLGHRVRSCFSFASSVAAFNVNFH